MVGDTESLFSSAHLQSLSQFATTNEERLGLNLLGNLTVNPLCDCEAQAGGSSENVFQTLLIKRPACELTPLYASLGNTNHCQFQGFSFFLQET